MLCHKVEPAVEPASALGTMRARRNGYEFGMIAITYQRSGPPPRCSGRLDRQNGYRRCCAIFVAGAKFCSTRESWST